MAEQSSEPTSVNFIDPAEFHKEGFVQEANRQFFHPLGLALSVEIDEDDGSVTLGPIWDYRADPEGLVFADGVMDPTKTHNVAVEHARHLKAREALYGQGGTQPPPTT